MLLTADKILYGNHVYGNLGIAIDGRGRIEAVGPLTQLGEPDCVLHNRLVMPGLISAHVQVARRLLRPGSCVDKTLAAHTLTPKQLYTLARQVFLELLLSGMTCVGAYHSLHHAPDGTPYANPHAMADALLLAAQEVGIRLSLVHGICLGDSTAAAPEAAHRRCAMPSLDAACHAFDAAVDRILTYNDPRLSWALGAHSLRHVPLDAVIGLKVRLGHMPIHLQVTPGAAAAHAYQSQHGRHPIEQLLQAEVLDACTTLLHPAAVPQELAALLAHSGALLCPAPSLGPAPRVEQRDAWPAAAAKGMLEQLPKVLPEHLVEPRKQRRPGDPSEYSPQSVSVCLSTDAAQPHCVQHSLATLDALGMWAQPTGTQPLPPHHPAHASGPLQAATLQGATALGLDSGTLQPGRWADLVCLSLSDPTLAEVADARLPEAALRSCAPAAVRDVLVGGQFVVKNGRHALSNSLDATGISPA
jgi:formimidoylglutamate deiminase